MKRKISLGELATAIEFLQQIGMVKTDIDTVIKLVDYLKKNCEGEIFIC